MAIGIEQHPDILLRLAVGKNCALINRPGRRSIQVRHTESRCCEAVCNPSTLGHTGRW